MRAATALTRWPPPPPTAAPATAGWPLDDGPDYSTDPDFSEMRFTVEESRPFRPIEEPGRVTRVVEAAAVTLDALGLLFRPK